MLFLCLSFPSLLSFSNFLLYLFLSPSCHLSIASIKKYFVCYQTTNVNHISYLSFPLCLSLLSSRPLKHTCTLLPPALLYLIPFPLCLKHLSVSVTPPPSSFHCFSIPFSIFSLYSSPFSISRPLTPPPTTTSTPMYNPPTPPLSFLSMCLLPSFFPYPKPSRHIILPVFLFPPPSLSACFSVSLSVSILISLSSLSALYSSSLRFPLFLSFPLQLSHCFPQCVCGGSKWSGLPAGINSTGPQPRAMCVCVCVWEDDWHSAQTHLLW